ncbi:MAG: O-antigen ligase family protein [Vicinamibacteraceae bacterium]
MNSLIERRGAGMAWLVALVLTLAWGALAFGAVYPWAYRPLVLATAVCGLWGLLQAAAPVRWSLVGGLGCVLLALLVQLAPLRWQVLETLSPAGHAVLMQYDLAYRLGVSSGAEVYHALSIHPDQTEKALSFLLGLGLLVLGASGALTRSTLRRLVLSIAMLGATLAIIGIVQKATHTGEIYGFWMPLEGKNPFGPFVNRNHFAGWMLMALPLAMGHLLGLLSRTLPRETLTPRERFLWLSTADGTRVVLVSFAVVAMGLSLVLTLSRSGVAAFACAVLVTIVMIARRQPARARRSIRLAYMAGLIATIVSWAGIDGIAARFAQADTASISGRLAIWGDTLTIVRDFPWTGTGVGTFAAANMFYQRALSENNVSAAHNDWLQLAAEGGVLVALPILALVVILVREMRFRFAEHARRGDLGVTYWTRVGAVTGLLAIGVQEVVEFSLHMPGNATLFAVVCAIAVAPVGTRRRSGERVDDGPARRL